VCDKRVRGIDEEVFVCGKGGGGHGEGLEGPENVVRVGSA
jgi:hypothetical protein